MELPVNVLHHLFFHVLNHVIILVQINYQLNNTLSIERYQLPFGIPLLHLSLFSRQFNFTMAGLRSKPLKLMLIVTGLELMVLVHEACVGVGVLVVGGGGGGV